MKELTLDQHLNNADDLAIAVKHLNNIIERCNYPKSHSVMLKLRRIKNSINNIRAELDTDYHQLINDEQFDLYGHVYYKEYS